MNRLKQYYLAIIVFLIPWQARLILGPPAELAVSDYIVASIYVMDVLMLIAILWCRPPLRWVSADKVFSPLLLLAFLLVASAFAIDPLSSVAKIILLIIILYFALTLKDQGDRNLMINALILSAVVQSLL